MKIAVSVSDNDMTSPVSERFGRAVGFIIYDMESGSNEYIDNTQNLESAQGAGIQSAKNVINSGARVLITGNVGPKAFDVLKKAGIDVYTRADGTVWDAIEDYNTGLLQKANDANAAPHW